MRIATLSLLGLLGAGYGVACGHSFDAFPTPDAGVDSSIADTSVKDSANDAMPVDASGQVDDATDGDLDAPVERWPGLVLWLDANKGVKKSGSDVTDWADQTSNKNDAKVGTGVKAPTFISSSINSLPALHFAGSSVIQGMEIADSTSLQWGTGDYYLAVVCKFDNKVYGDGGVLPPADGGATGVAALYSKIGGPGGVSFLANVYDVNTLKLRPGVSLIETLYDEVSYAASYNDGTARLYSVRRSGSSWFLHVNGSPVAVGVETKPVFVDAVGFPITIGYGFFGGDGLDGDIAEMLAVKGSLSPSDLSNIESYLTTKYSL